MTVLSPVLQGNIAQTVVQALPFMAVGACWVRARSAALPVLAAVLTLWSVTCAFARLVAVIVIARAGGGQYDFKELWFSMWRYDWTLYCLMRALGILAAILWIVLLWRKVRRRERKVPAVAAATLLGMLVPVAPEMLWPVELRIRSKEEMLRMNAAWINLQSSPGSPRWIVAAPPEVPARFSLGRALDDGYERAWACGIDSSRHVACWRPERAHPELRVLGPTLASMVSTGDNFACAVDTDGRPHCWYPDGRELTTPPRNDVVALDAHEEVVCAQSADGHRFCWMYLHGNSVLYYPLDPYECQWTISAPDARAIAIGFRGGVCALTPLGAIACGAYCRSEPLVLEPAILEAVPVDDAAIGVAASGPQLCVIAREGVRCITVDWNDTLLPTSFRPMAGVAQIAVAVDHACARTRQGHIDCWGNDEWGQSDLHDVDDATWIDVAYEVTCVARARGIECRGRQMRR